ncbi:MAG: hypothetical protein K5819_07820 [Lachnospiraceae bacterium]|nr:hypothetical protein [Lachnospiraceae bacterium]
MMEPVQITLFDYLESLENIEREIEIKGAINPKVSLKEIDVRLLYGDLVLIVSMIRDYVRGLDEVKQDDIQWQAYYRNKFWDMAEKISDQIGYDYDAALKKCLKKQEKKSDVGEDALILALKKQKAKSKEQNTEAAGKEEKGEQNGEQKEQETAG